MLAITLFLATMRPALPTSFCLLAVLAGCNGLRLPAAGQRMAAASLRRSRAVSSYSSHFAPSANYRSRACSRLQLSEREVRKTSAGDEAAAVPDAEENLLPSYLILAVLLTTFASNQWSRQAIYYLCDFSSSGDAFKHINVGLDFTKEMYASLASFGFTAVFAVVSVFAGSVSDRIDRRSTLALSCAVWSAATALHARADSFLDLVPLRAVVGAAQAFFNPAAYTLLADIFPARMVGSVNGIFSSGIFLGGALASLSILLDEQVGWRSTMTAIGGAGLVTSLLCLALVKDPRDRATNPVVEVDISADSGAEKGSGGLSFSLSEGLSAVREVTQSYEAKLLFAASTVRFCAGFSLVIWKAPLVFAKFPGSEAAFAGSNAAIVAGGGILSSLLGGWISDRLANPVDPSSTRPLARSWVSAVGSLLAAPCWAGFVLASTPEAAAGFLFLEYLVAECWFGPTLASLFSVVPAKRRGAAQGLFSVLTAAGNLGPVLGATTASGAVAGLDLGTVLLVEVCGCYLISALLFALAA
ncbi:major facilitator superfamily domain-containing protein, partial [Ochromonadaceae sp. CCMP2298]